MQITLYYAPFTCALVPYVALVEAAVEFDVHVINFFQGEHLSEEYRRLNPKHKVPLLKVDGAYLTENVAILQWIARTFPDAELLPGGSDEFKAISLMAWCASGIHPTLTPNVVPQKYCDLPEAADNVRQCAQKLMHEQFALAESLLEDREWFFENFSIPDIYFFWCFRRAKQFSLDLSPYPHCGQHWERIASRDSMRRLQALETETLGEQSSH